jgi:hypothetical protein
MAPCIMVFRIAISFLSFCNKHESGKYVTIMKPLRTLNGAQQICKNLKFSQHLKVIFPNNDSKSVVVYIISLMQCSYMFASRNMRHITNRQVLFIL